MSQESPEALVYLENPGSLASLDVLDQRDVLVLWGDLADLAPPASQVLMVKLARLDSLDPQESKVSPVLQDVLEFPVASGAATVSDTPW